MTALQLPSTAVSTDKRSNANRRTILVVDDDPLVRALLAHALEDADFDVVEAGDGADALELLGERRFALVLLDGRLPRLSGRHLLHQLRANPTTATLPVILITADDALADRLSGLSAGADDYVTKPFSPDEVVARVHAQLRAHDAWDRTLAAHQRQRAAISAAFAGAARQGTLEGAAAVLCNALADQGGIASATLVRFTVDRRAVPVASAGGPYWGLHAGEPPPPPLGAYLLERGSSGPWLEPQPPAVCAPLPDAGSGTTPGVLVLELDGSGSVEPATALAGAIDCAAAISGLLRPRLLERDRIELDGSEVRALLDDGAFRPHFQPIVDLLSGEVIGAEALTRFADGSSPEDRFHEAAAVGLGIELELQTLKAAVIEARDLTPASAWISLNVSPALLLSAPPSALRDVLDLRDGREIVLELSEQESVSDYDAVRSALRAAGDGVRWSIDDAGSGFASLRHILRLDPAYIKLDRSWVRGIDDDSARQAMIAGLRHFADSTGAQLIAEGIEREDECEALIDLRVDLGQGFLLGRPAALSA